MLQPDRKKKKGTTLHLSEFAGDSASLAAQKKREAAAAAAAAGEGGYEDLFDSEQHAGEVRAAAASQLQHCLSWAAAALCGLGQA